MTLWAQIDSYCTTNFLTRSLHSCKKTMRSLHRKTVALVMRSLVGVQKSGTQMVPGPFPDIPVEGALAGPPGTRGVGWRACRAERRPMPAPCKLCWFRSP